jgi:hypothetical protein
VHSGGGSPASQAPDGKENSRPTLGRDATARDWAKKMLGSTQSSVGLVVAAVAAVIGSALGNLLVRHYIVALIGLGSYGLVTLSLYHWAAIRRSLSRLRRGELLVSRRKSGPAPPRRRLTRVCSVAAILLGTLAAFCYVLGYWGIGSGFAHGAGWGALSLLTTLTVVVLVARRWQRSRASRVRYRSAMAYCVAAAGLSAGATLGSGNLVPPCAAPAELTVLTSQEDLAAVQAAIPGFEQHEPTGLHTACYAVDVTAYAAPTDDDAWHGLETGWGTAALSAVGPRPDVWIPGSSAEVAAVREHHGPRLVSLGSIASSPLVVAVPASLLSGPLARLPKLRNTWGGIYHALSQEHIGLAIPDPGVSETALLGIAGLYPDLTSAEEHRIESSGSFPADSENLLCDAAQTAERGGRPPSAAYLVSEAALIASNANQLTEGACATLTQQPGPMTAFYPAGAATLDFPFITVGWGAADGGTLNGYETDFYDWLASGKAGSRLTGAGLRSPGCEAFSQVSTYITAVVPGCEAAGLPTEAAVAAAQGSFRQAQAPAHIVVGIDDSGPMQPYLPQITAAVDVELGPRATHIGSRDSFGIWKLPGDRQGQVDQQLVDFGTAGVTEARVPAGVGALAGHGHSADYAMLKRAGQLLYAQTAADPEPRNSVILLTNGDGFPQGDPGGDSGVSVTGYFDRPPSGHSAIRLYIIAFGPAGCAQSSTVPASQSLAAFADATGGTCLQANGADPGQLLAQLLSQISTSG